MGPCRRLAREPPPKNGFYHVKKTVHFNTLSHPQKNVEGVGVTVLNRRVAHLGSLIMNPVSLWVQLRRQVSVSHRAPVKMKEKPVLLQKKKKSSPNIAMWPHQKKKKKKKKSERVEIRAGRREKEKEREMFEDVAHTIS